jgi:hypothetical protein
VGVICPGWKEGTRAKISFNSLVAKGKKMSFPGENFSCKQQKGHIQLKNPGLYNYASENGYFCYLQKAAYFLLP